MSSLPINISNLLEDDGLRQTLTSFLHPKDVASFANTCVRIHSLCKLSYGCCNERDCKNLAKYNATLSSRQLPMCHGSCCRKDNNMAILKCKSHTELLFRCPKCHVTFCNNSNNQKLCQTARCSNTYCCSCINKCTMRDNPHADTACSLYFCDNHRGICSSPNHEGGLHCLECTSLCHKCKTPVCKTCAGKCQVCWSPACLLTGCPESQRNDQRKQDNKPCAFHDRGEGGDDDTPLGTCQVHEYVCQECTGKWRCQRCGHLVCMLTECKACKAKVCIDHLAKVRSFCHVCNNDDFCEDHISGCAACSRQACNRHAQCCSGCQKRFCERCGLSCRGCSKLFCWKCLSSLKSVFPSGSMQITNDTSPPSFLCPLHVESIPTCPKCHLGYNSKHCFKKLGVTFSACSTPGCTDVSCKENCSSVGCNVCGKHYCSRCAYYASLSRYAGDTPVTWCDKCYKITCCWCECSYCRRRFCSTENKHGRLCEGGCDDPVYVCDHCAQRRFIAEYDLPDHKYYCYHCKHRERLKDQRYQNAVETESIRY